LSFEKTKMEVTGKMKLKEFHAIEIIKRGGGTDKDEK
jgi:hypothetical protein